MTNRAVPEAATFGWDDLAKRLEQFIETWDRGTEPTIAEFLPPEPQSHRRLVLIELVKVDLEQRSTRGARRALEAYTTEFPELLENGEPPCDLIYEEYHIRRTAGDNVSPSEYYRRFPGSADALKRLMGTENFSATTQLVSTRRIEGFRAGEKIEDFDLLVELGKGAFGSVFLARQISMQRMVALKLSADKGNEPQTLATLEHPNIIRVYDQRKLPGQPVRLLYMQFAPGGTLAEVIKLVRVTPPAARNGGLLITAVNEAVERSGAVATDNTRLKRRLDAAGWPETVCRLGVQLAHALDHAHRQGVLHRDVKPANVLLAADGSPKLADFNISFCSQLDGASPAAYFGGSLAYMSPEQIEACNPAHDRQPKDLDGRSDLFSLAVVLWEMVYGQRPFTDDDMDSGWTAMLTAMAKRRRSEQPIAPSGQKDAVAVRMEHVLRKTLSPDPDQRPADGAAMARELMLCLNPRAWDLVNDLKTGWRDFARRHPYLALFPANLPIFLAAGGFNLWYNYEYYAKSLSENLQASFQLSAWIWNPILYSIGTFLVLWWATPVARALAQLNRGEHVNGDVLIAARRRAVQLGHGVAAVGMGLWLVAGIIFPIFIQLHGREWLPRHGMIYFAMSMIACGIISCCLPFLATTWLSVRAYFPALLVSGSPEPAEQRRLLDVGRWSSIYLFTSPIAPLIGLLLVMFSPQPPNSSADPRTAMILLIAFAMGGFLVAFLTWQRIRADLEALSVVSRPADMVGTTSDTVDTI
jgi:serine/threonine protein kinase